MSKLGLEKAEEPEIKLPRFAGSERKKREFHKSIYCFIDCAKAFDYMDNNKLWKHLKSWGYQTVLPVSWETCIRDKKQQLEPYMEQLTDSKWRKGYDKAVYCHPYLTYTQSTSWEMLG